MHKLIKTLLLLLVLSGCNNIQQKTNQAKNNPQNQGNNKPVEKTLDFGEPIQIDTSAYVMLPLHVKHENNRFKSSGDSYEQNIVFLNTKTQQYHLLDSTRKMLIRSYNIDQSTGDYNGNNDHKANEKYLYYSVTVNDANNNGRLDNDDPVYLFISDMAGYNFRQISPDNYYVQSWKVIKETGKIVIYAYSAGNGKKDNDKKEVTPFIYDLKTGATCRQIFSENFLRDTRKLFGNE
jgi:hypothetical protein